MSVYLKLLFAAILFSSLFTQDEIANHPIFEKVGEDETPNVVAAIGDEWIAIDSSEALESDYSSDETVYSWDEQMMDWTVAEEKQEFWTQVAANSSTDHPSTEPIEIEWNVLMDIQYKLKYFKELDMEIYAPVFTKAVEALHKKEVIIKGFVIPLDEEGEILSLSANPYASCFFCGQASPASVISMYLKNKRKRYKMDDFKKFKGILHLNEDDPNEFYYILRNATEE